MNFTGVPRRFRPKPRPDPVDVERDPANPDPFRPRRRLRRILDPSRPIHHLLGRIRGESWLHCPTCGRWFARHEYRGRTVHMVPDAAPGAARLVCPKCAARGLGRTSVPRWEVEDAP